MQSDDLNAQKQAARRAARQQVAQISPQEFSAIGAAMWQTLQAQPAWQNAESVFCFVGALHEPDTMPILQGALSAGKQLLVPRIAGPGQMQLVPLQSLEQLQLLAIKVQIILGRHMGNGAFAAITADKALAAGKNVDG